MTGDPRCGGSGTCNLDATRRCACSPPWQDQKMCHAAPAAQPAAQAGPASRPSPAKDGV
jgi:hypothetical protein